MEIKGERSLVSDSELIAGLFHFMAPTSFSKSLRALQAKGRPAGDEGDRGRRPEPRVCEHEELQKSWSHIILHRKDGEKPHASVFWRRVSAGSFFVPQRRWNSRKRGGKLCLFDEEPQSGAGEQVKGRFKNSFSLLLWLKYPLRRRNLHIPVTSQLFFPPSLFLSLYRSLLFFLPSPKNGSTHLILSSSKGQKIQ